MKFIDKHGATILEVDDEIEELTFPRLEVETVCENLRAGLAALGSLRSLTFMLSRRRDPRELAALCGLSRLSELRITSLWKDADLAPVATCGGLRVLRLVGVDGIDVTPVAALTGLNELFLAGAARNLRSLGSLEKLTRLGIEEARNVSVRWFARNRGLQHLSLSGSSVREFSSFPELLEIDARSTNLASIDELCTQPKLDVLHIDRCRKLHSLQGLQRFGRLRILTMAGLTGIDSLSPLDSLQNLTTIDLRGVRIPPSELGRLAGLPQLARVQADPALASTLRNEATKYPGWRAQIGALTQDFIETADGFAISATRGSDSITYRIDEDLTGVLRVKTNDEAELMIREALKTAPESALIEFDSEAAQFLARSTSLEALRVLAHEIARLATRRRTVTRSARPNEPRT